MNQEATMNELTGKPEHDDRPAVDAAAIGSEAPAGSEVPGGVSISIQRVTKEFGSGGDLVRALDDVSVDIRDGEFFTLLGPSGCGKTTLLRMIAGFEAPTQGSILLHGQDLVGLPPYKRAVNTVFQSYALFPHMTVAENLAFGLEMHHVPRREIEQRVQEMLALVKLEDYGRRKPAQLSGGQQQRVALARALANHPKVLLLDEPLSALDLKLRKEMQIELKRLQNETGITFVFVTHDQEEALTMSDRIAVMNAGKVLQSGTPREIYEQPDNRFVADFIGETNLMVAEVVAVDGKYSDYRLDSGAVVRGCSRDEAKEGVRVTLALRPERADITEVDQGVLGGTIENIVYFGTDTLYQVRIESEEVVHVRTQNVDGSGGAVDTGAKVGLAFSPDALQVLSD